MPYFWQAAVQGDSLAAFTLGQLYNKDPNVDRNVKAAAYWYRRASIPTLNQQAYLELAFLLKNKEVEWQPGDPVLPPATAPDAAINATP
jgi:TPR repeat protein